MPTNLTKPAYFEQNPPAVAEGVDYIGCMPWLVALGFDRLDVFCFVADLLVARQRQEDNRAV